MLDPALKRSRPFRGDAECAPGGAQVRARAVILIIDDVPTNITLLRAILAPSYEILAALDARDGLVLALEQRPDLILLDINMPKMDGIQALEEIRKASPETMVLMVSGDSTMEKVKEALDKGAAGFVVKPIKPSSVIDKITSCFKNKKIASPPRG